MPHEYEYDMPRAALREKIVAEISKHGPNCSLNHLDLTGVGNMEALFEGLDFNGDISKWDVSRVWSMQWMFKGTPFNGDISAWNTRTVQDMGAMFESCLFNGDISNWKVLYAGNKARMFMDSAFNGDLSKWDMSATKQTFLMFANSVFNQPIGMWNLQSAVHTTEMFSGSSFNQDISAWHLPVGSHHKMFFNSQYQGPMPTLKIDPKSLSAARPEPLLDSMYRGDFQNKYSLAEARTLFGTFKSADTYLQARIEAGHALDRLHIEKLVTSKKKPIWASKELSDWIRSEQSVHRGLNLPEAESIALLNRSYRERFLGQNKPTVDSIPFDFAAVG